MYIDLFTTVSDKSFQSKFDILSSLSKIKDTPILTVLFGNGTKGYTLYSYEVGKYAHLLISILLGVLGVFGTIMYFITWLIML